MAKYNSASIFLVYFKCIALNRSFIFKKMKKILIIIPIVASCAAFYAYQQWHKPHLDVQAASEEVSLSATELFTQFATNEALANPKYLSKVVKVCGKIAQNSETNEGSITIQLETGDDIGVVMCELDDLTKQEKTTFAKGDDVCFKGLCSGYTSDVVLNRCVIAK